MSPAFSLSGAASVGVWSGGRAWTSSGVNTTASPPSAAVPAVAGAFLGGGFAARLRWRVAVGRRAGLRRRVLGDLLAVAGTVVPGS
jgi:hypothetical protein